MKLIADRCLQHRDGPGTPLRIIESGAEFEVDKTEAERLIQRGFAHAKANVKKPETSADPSAALPPATKEGSRHGTD
jgi:hypothetical protein